MCGEANDALDNARQKSLVRNDALRFLPARVRSEGDVPISFASACGPVKSGSDSMALHSETQQPQLMQSASLWITFMRSCEIRCSRPAGGTGGGGPISDLDVHDHTFQIKGHGTILRADILTNDAMRSSAG